MIDIEPLTGADGLQLGPDDALDFIVSGPDTSGVELEVAEEEAVPDSTNVAATQAFPSDAVFISNVDCATGALTSFAAGVSISARWSTRLSYRLANGNWAQSPVYTFSYAFAANTRYGVTFRGRLPANSRVLQATWWYPNSGFYYYNQRAISC